jgi:hypothetical protein
MADAETLKAKATVERHNAAWSVWADNAPKFVVQFKGQRRDGGSVIEGEMRRLDLPDKPLAMKWFRMGRSSVADRFRRPPRSGLRSPRAKSEEAAGRADA